jgi:hypothetical protein
VSLCYRKSDRKTSIHERRDRDARSTGKRHIWIETQGKLTAESDGLVWLVLAFFGRTGRWEWIEQVTSEVYGEMAVFGKQSGG